MHDPDVVAFEIRRPWPKRERMYNSTHPKREKDLPRWKLNGCFWTIAGVGLYWPSMITVWHQEPGGHDSGEVCKHYTRWQNEDGKWQSKILHGWKWHVQHWRIQIGPLQTLRRWALTRCSWCGGRPGKHDPVNISHQWDGPRGRWWRGEPGLFHRDCSSIERAHATCVCDEPDLPPSRYGRCRSCNKSSSYGRTELQVAQARILAAVPAGQRDAAAYQRVCDMYAASKGINA